MLYYDTIWKEYKEDITGIPKLKGFDISVIFIHFYFKKAGYMATPVACGSARAIFEVT